MCMISVLVEKLRELGNDPEIDCYGINELNNVCVQAADIIEALSVKLDAANRGGWIDFNNKLPKNEEKVLLSKNGKTLQDLFEFYFPDENCEDCDVMGFLEGESSYYDGFTILNGNKDNIKWQPLPEPYRPQPKRS